MGAREAAIKVFQKIESSAEGVDFAVFLSKDRTAVRACRPATDLFAEMMRKTPECFAGVFGINGSVELIEENLLYMGMPE